MKSKKITLIALALASIAMVACNDNNQTNSNGTGSSAVNVYVDSIISKDDKDLPYLVVNQQIDLADYFEVEYSDGSKDANFSISAFENAKDAILIEGTKVTAYTTGTFDLTLKAGNYDCIKTIDCRTTNGIKVIEFFKNLAEVGTNYSIDSMDMNNRGQLIYEGSTSVHTDKYFAMYNKDNPGETAKNGEQNSIILAILSDNKIYQGNFDTDGNPAFEPGDLGGDWGNYYVNMPLAIDGGMFSSTFDKLGDEVMTAKSDVTSKICQTGFLVSLNSGYTIGETEIYDFGEDENGKISYIDLLMYCYAADDTAHTTPYLFSIFRIRDVGTTSVESLERVSKDTSYLPEAINVDELKTAMTNLKTAENYTVTTTIEPADRNGTTVTNPDDTYAYVRVFGTDKPLTEVTTVTPDGIESVLKDGEDVIAKAAYFNRDGHAYEVIGKLNADKVLEYTAKELSAANAVEAPEALKFTAAGITDASIDATLWNKKTARNDGTFALVGKVGDNDGSAPTNGFYKEMMDQMALVTFKDEDTGDSIGYGSHYTAAIKGWDEAGVELHALSINSSYESVIFNPTTGAINAKANIQYPALAGTQNLYWNTIYAVSEIGTTAAADFSGYAIA
ncbi:MAG: hypothetical protein J6328_05045 [Bacilli bacterium]|nr:hypothetical protein [Bacilli bacterium]